MLKLTKTKSAAWNGNGFGASAADWTIKGCEHIRVTKLSTGWNAFDGDTRLATGSTRDIMLQILESKLAS